jgi:hypothetical protein
VILHEAAQSAEGGCQSHADQALGLISDRGDHLLAFRTVTGFPRVFYLRRHG